MSNEIEQAEPKIYYVNGEPRVERKSQCTATSRQTGERCRARAVSGSRTCRHHGGHVLLGVANPNFKHGGYSRLPEVLRQSYQEARADPNLLSVANELAVLRALAEETVGTLSEDVAVAGRESSKAFREWQAVKQGGNLVRMQEQLSRFESAFAEAEKIEGRLNKLMTLFENIRRLSDTETRRLVLSKNMMTRDEAQLFASWVQNAVVDAVELIEDESLRRKVLGAYTSRLNAVVTMRS